MRVRPKHRFGRMAPASDRAGTGCKPHSCASQSLAFSRESLRRVPPFRGDMECGSRSIDMNGGARPSLVPGEAHPVLPQGPAVSGLSLLPLPTYLQLQ